MKADMAGARALDAGVLSLTGPLDPALPSLQRGTTKD